MFLVKHHLSKHIVFVLLALLFSFVIGVGLAELMVRITSPNLRPYSLFVKNPPFIINGQEYLFPQRYTPDSIFAFTLKADYQSHHIQTGVHDFSFSTNHEGFRQEGNLEELITQHAHAKRIMVIGDSLTFAHGVNQEDSFVEISNQQSQGHSYFFNFGVGGYGFAEYYLLYQQYQGKVKPDLVILGVFPSNDFHDLEDTIIVDTDEEGYPIASRRKKYYFDAQGNFRYDGIKYKYPMLRNSFLWLFLCERGIIPERHSYDNTELQEQTPQIAAKLVTKLSEHMKLLVVIFPAQYNFEKNQYNDAIYKAKQAFLDRLQQQPHIAILDFYPVFADQNRYKESYLADYSHFNRKGHELVARILMNFIVEHDLL